MKTIDYSRICFALFVILLTAGFLSSCEEDVEGAKKITVNQIFLHNADSTTGVITEARVGTLVRIDGSGFSTLEAVYCNGTKASINPNFVTEASILFPLPAKGIKVGVHADENERNIIRLVTKYDDYSFAFSILTTPPVARNDSYNVGHDETLTVPVAEGVMSNDVDQDGDKLTPVLVSTTSNGSLTFNENGSFVYVPPAGYIGDDSFTYYVDDGNVISSVVTVEIQVTGSPSITTVSHTFAKVGETIVIYGAGFAKIDSVIFPDNKVLTKAKSEFTINSQNSAITCVVPAGIAKGELELRGAGESIRSSNYMFRSECIIMPTFAYGDVYFGSNPGTLGGLSGNQNAAIPSVGNPKSPAAFRQVPAAAPSTTTLTVSPNAAFWFNFNPKDAANKVIANTTSTSLITNATKCKDLAFQFDIYVPVPWGSGFFTFDFKPNNAGFAGDVAPLWVAGNGAVTDVTMTGWQTATLPLGDVPGLESMTMQDVINSLTANGTVTFYNKDYTDSAGTTHTAKAIPNFQVMFGSFRIVPYTKPQ
jgi:hypothetical protein